MSHLPSEPEFEQAVNEITSTLGPFLAKHPEYERALEVCKIPERVIQFRVTWEADDGSVRVNRGYRVQAKVLISGSGNVAQYAALKVLELGGNVLSLSDSKGALVAVDGKGFTKEDIQDIAQIKLNREYLTNFVSTAEKGRFEYHEGKRPWGLIEFSDIALPCATQNEVSGEDAKALIQSGVKFIAEGSNMGCTQEAIDVFETARKSGGDRWIWYAPGKASNCGGVAVSGLEMAQNSQRLTWSTEEVDGKLKDIMTNAFNSCYNTGKEYGGNDSELDIPSLVTGANICGFIKVANAMRDHGDWW
ncbi:hypothetical protein FRC07_004376 [Ceratobasidium sp. 392]|nr:hypothetical protein FRC07_004376 [Ceratobasidium sp. 392]